MLLSWELVGATLNKETYTDSWCLSPATFLVSIFWSRTVVKAQLCNGATPLGEEEWLCTPQVHTRTYLLCRGLVGVVHDVQQGSVMMEALVCRGLYDHCLHHWERCCIGSSSLLLG
jgi:hypothetical protein